MSDQEPADLNDAKPKKYPFWPDSMQQEDYYLTRDQVRPSFAASLQKALIALAKVAGQAFIFVFASIVFPLIFLLIYGENNSQVFLLIAALIVAIAVTVSVFLSVRLFEDAEPVELGLKLNQQAVQQLFIGLFFALLVLAAQFWLYLELGRVEVHGFAWQSRPFSAFVSDLLIAFLIPVLASWSHELLFRGYYLRILTDGFGRINAILLTSILAAYLPFIVFILAGAFVIQLFIFHFLFGLLMTFAIVRTGQLWLAIGLHAGWSFFGGVLFANTSMLSVNFFKIMEVDSGLTVTQALITDLLGLAIIALLIQIYTSRQLTKKQSTAN